MAEKTPAPAATDALADQELTLDEFCSRLSSTDRRVEMIGAFHSVEKQAGRVKGLSADFAGRFTAFCNQPA